LQIARDNGSDAIAIGGGALETIQTESGFPFLFIETMACKTFVCQNRAYVSVETKGFLGSCRIRTVHEHKPASDEPEATKNGPDLHRSVL
jgi:hypothetical protein